MDEPESGFFRRLVDRDETALRAVVDEYGPLVNGIASRVAGNSDFAADVTQQVFVELWRTPERFVSGSSLRVCLATLAHGRAVDMLRRECSYQLRHLRLRALASDGASAGPIDVAQLVVDEAERGARSRAVVAAVMSLDPKYRRAIELAYWEGHTYREVAVLMEAPEGTVKTWIRVGLRQLAALIKPTVEQFADG